MWVLTNSEVRTQPTRRRRLRHHQVGLKAFAFRHILWTYSFSFFRSFNYWVTQWNAALWLDVIQGDNCFLVWCWWTGPGPGLGAGSLWAGNVSVNSLVLNPQLNVSKPGFIIHTDKRKSQEMIFRLWKVHYIFSLTNRSNEYIIWTLQRWTEVL